MATAFDRLERAAVSWLAERYKTGQQRVTWQEIVAAVNKPAKGDEQAIARMCDHLMGLALIGPADIIHPAGQLRPNYRIGPLILDAARDPAGMTIRAVQWRAAREAERNSRLSVSARFPGLLPRRLQQAMGLVGDAGSNGSVASLPRAYVDKIARVLIMDGKPFGLSKDEEIEYLAVLCRNLGERMSDPQVAAQSQLLADSCGSERPRFKRIRDNLPHAVKALLDSNKNGTKLVLPQRP
jgi:hypothetical protein